MEVIVKGIQFLNSILWDYVLLFVLVGVGVFLSIKLKFPQISRMFPAMGKMFSDIKNKTEVPEGRMTPFQSLTTAVAAQVGTGNVVGVSTAIAAGGPGAAFWMLFSAFFGMSTIFVEAVLAQIFRETKNGELVGGPAYYIKNGLKSEWLSVIFAVFAIAALGFAGIMVQSNSVAVSVKTAFGFSNTWIAAGLLAVVGMILTGGMGRIASFTEKVVPVMAILYILGSLAIIIINASQFLPAIKAIFLGAFSPEAISGGVLGITVQHAVRYGVARGLFSNEAGMGSTPHSHAVASSDHPAEQGFTAMIGVFICTFLICLSTIIINLVSGSYDMTVPAELMKETGSTMTLKGFTLVFGRFGEIFLPVALTFFALTTIIGWYFVAESNVKLLAGKNKIIIAGFKFIVLTFMVLGIYLDPSFVWQLTDLFTGLMALPNIAALLLLSGKAKEVLSHYDRCKKEGKLSWKYEFE
ncbi:alanine/glycine:cation symporter family protein [Treponema pedis]|uniref:Alanine:cation symporter family protein n=1 Tax=Treponema pedis TaxID=409322 RepID=A0A7S7AX64_9SPIR|nr:alanine/glycine:cation symporter family protein [Treponema pedis]QOW62060.1 alanine:cation symporter family protein [Treponema pedis]